MSNRKHHQRGFVDPISLGFLLAILGATGAMSTEEAKAPQNGAQDGPQVQVVQPAEVSGSRLAAIDLE